MRRTKNPCYVVTIAPSCGLTETILFSTPELYFPVSFKPPDLSLLISPHLCPLLVYSSPVSFLLLLHATSIPICPTQL